MDQILMNELLDKLENRTCVRFHSNTEMQEFISLVKGLTPQRYFPRAGTWKFGAGTSEQTLWKRWKGRIELFIPGNLR